jgi:bifunctional non-homologous end joining protein LigD
MEGEKLRGAWSLHRMRRRDGETRAHWLLIKQDDQFASRSHEVTQEGRSVLSGRTIEDVAQARSTPTPRRKAS